jgi:hypothetical protein
MMDPIEPNKTLVPGQSQSRHFDVDVGHPKLLR